jgi:hypothetical protein
MSLRAKPYYARSTVEKAFTRLFEESPWFRFLLRSSLGAVNAELCLLVDLQLSLLDPALLF